MIDELIEEMTTECHVCRGHGVKVDSEGQYELGSEETCSECNGTGKELNHEGWKLRQLILTGEMEGGG